MCPHRHVACSAWSVENDMLKLQLHEIKLFVSEPHKKLSEQLNGYHIALDPAMWLVKKEGMISDREWRSLMGCRQERREEEET
ncbi:uncharacterized protein LACBIDRAFT_300244 [Laccaria bicolor S238N-H82]|uniref:Predicted protein n=1 Tax=Laccaria bicolor (strain S238N-H82 / ATCC MYA-4686) TaxID=486041 RepID=B0E3W6_LACBS|nr:uncharacterized protein LACBIDRAFT_300244 [Laccaria bicolor S238N-H82]EDQ98467.1 predicted protein [Laccaria bicolor S238N-H82]|eukprot:XP_001890884.1 predicted protein [Laccaria bicolor S238N-H82]